MNNNYDLSSSIFIKKINEIETEIFFYLKISLAFSIAVMILGLMGEINEFTNFFAKKIIAENTAPLTILFSVFCLGLIRFIFIILEGFIHLDSKLLVYLEEWGKGSLFVMLGISLGGVINIFMSMPDYRIDALLIGIKIFSIIVVGTFSYTVIVYTNSQFKLYEISSTFRFLVFFSWVILFELVVYSWMLIYLYVTQGTQG